MIETERFPAWVYKKARDLAQRADEVGHPTAGRRYELTGTLGELYGIPVVAGTFQAPMKLVLVCQTTTERRYE